MQSDSSPDPTLDGPATIHVDQDYDVLGRLGFDGFVTTYRVQDAQQTRYILREFSHERFPAGEMVEKYWKAAQKYWKQVEEEIQIPTTPDTVKLPSSAGTSNSFRLLKSIRSHDGIYYMLYTDHPHLYTLKDWYENLINIRQTEPKFYLSKVLLPLCQQIHAAHQRGIIHRDLAPTTIFLVYNPEPEHEICFPFIFSWHSAIEHPIELCHQIPPHIEELAGTMDDPIGTPGFFAPEIPMLKRSTVATDIYSLGALLNYLITGRARVSDACQEDFILNPKQQLPLHTDDFALLILKATQFEPSNRYHKISEMVQDINAVLEDNPVIHASPVLLLPVGIGLIIDFGEEHALYYLPLEVGRMNLDQGLS